METPYNAPMLIDTYAQVDSCHVERSRDISGFCPAQERMSDSSAPLGMTNMLIDTHAHLDFPDFANDLEDVLRRARKLGVKRVITIGTSIESSRRAIELCGKLSCCLRGDWRSSQLT